MTYHNLLEVPCELTVGGPMCLLPGFLGVGISGAKKAQVSKWRLPQHLPASMSQSPALDMLKEGDMLRGGIIDRGQEGEDMGTSI